MNLKHEKILTENANAPHYNSIIIQKQFSQLSSVPYTLSVVTSEDLWNARVINSCCSSFGGGILVKYHNAVILKAWH
jgi:hypothetical protein